MTRIYLVCGPGGVGKTTTAASLAVHLAKEKHRTVVLTVDPAKRLAQAMGIDSIGSDLKEIQITNSSETLSAAMLDARRYFDQLIERVSLSREQTQRILNNPMYQSVMEHLGGTHEYAAMERLYEFSTQAQFEKIVVDTPPSQNAMDFFTAPKRMADFMDPSIFGFFAGRKRIFGIFQRGAKLTLDFLQKIVGAEFFRSFTELMQNFEGMQKGFSERNTRSLELLTSPSTDIFVVTYPSEIRFLETKLFISQLKELGFNLCGLIINRVQKDPLAVPSVELSPSEKKVLDYFHEIHLEQKRWIDAFKQEFTLPIHLVPENPYLACDLKTLEEMGSLIFQKSN